MVKIYPFEDCWLYLGTPNYYYGRFHQENAHRVSYRIHHGVIPKGMAIDHLCKNTRCINPEHLEMVTVEENNRRSTSPTAINARKTVSKCGLPFDYRRRDGYRGCHNCDQLATKKLYDKKRDIILAQHKEYYRRNRTAILKRVKAYDARIAQRIGEMEVE